MTLGKLALGALVVQVLALVLKLTGVLTAPWWAVLIPLWLALGGFAWFGLSLWLALEMWRQ